VLESRKQEAASREQRRESNRERKNDRTDFRRRSKGIALLFLPQNIK
jgi:hypothetical protein